MDTEHFCEVKNFNELYALIKSDFEYNCRIYGPDSPNSSDYIEAARLTYVRVRRSVLDENPSLSIPSVPQSTDVVTIMDCCTDAQIIIKTSALLKPAEQGVTVPLSKEMPKEIKKADSANTYPAETERNAAPAKGWGIKRITGWIFKKTSHFILTVIVTIFATVIAAIVVDIFADFGWLQSIKAFIYSIRWPK